MAEVGCNNTRRYGFAIILSLLLLHWSFLTVQAWLAPLDIEPSRCVEETGRMGTPLFIIWHRWFHRSSVKRQAADVLLRHSTDRTESTLLQNDLSVMFVNSVIEDIKKYPSHVPERISCTIMHLLSKAKGFHMLTLTDLMEAQEKDVFCQRAPKQIGHRGREVLLNEDGVIIR